MTDFGLYLYLAPGTRIYARKTLAREERHMDGHDHRMRKRGKIVLIGFLLVAGFFLITEHTAHFLGVLPYLILLACRAHAPVHASRSWRPSAWP